MHYAIGDVHGSYDELMDLLNMIEKHDNDARFIFLGDFVDRGPDVWKVLEWIMNNISIDGKYQSVMGNHESLIIDWYKEWLYWWNRGGFDGEDLMPETHFDFTYWLDSMNCLSPEKIEPIISFFKSLPTRKEIIITTPSGRHIQYNIVHAWDAFDKNLSEDEIKNINLWKRNCYGNYENDIIIVHGHTPTISDMYKSTGFTRPGMIAYRHNSINIDGGCCFSDNYRQYPCFLCAICLETLEEFYNCDLDERMHKIKRSYESDEDIQLKINAYKKYFIENDDLFRNKLLKRLNIR